MNERNTIIVEIFLQMTVLVSLFLSTSFTHARAKRFVFALELFLIFGIALLSYLYISAYGKSIGWLEVSSFLLMSLINVILGLRKYLIRAKRM